MQVQQIRIEREPASPPVVTVIENPEVKRQQGFASQRVVPGHLDGSACQQLRQDQVRRRSEALAEPFILPPPLFLQAVLQLQRSQTLA
jgi:hypothetical protein